MNKVRVGIVGTSWWTDSVHLPGFNSHSAAAVVAICGRDQARAREIAQKRGVPRVFSDYREMIGTAGLDAVAIVTPDDTHHAMTLAALDAGCHVLCEKPLANNAADARAMLDKAEASGLKHMVLFTWRWQPHWRYVKRLVDDGFIGRCERARFDFIGGYARDPGYKWRFDGRRANGIVGDLGSHMIDFARWFLGDIAAVSAELAVFADQSQYADFPLAPANDTAFLALRLKSGAMAQIQASATTLLGGQNVRISVQLHGDDGTIEVDHIFDGANTDITFRGLRRGDAHLAPMTIPDEYFEGGVRPNGLFDPYIKQAAGPRLFVDCIIGNHRAVPSFLDGLRVQEVVDAALASSAAKRWVSLE